MLQAAGAPMKPYCGKIGTIHADIAMVFPVSDEAEFIIGIAMEVDGGCCIYAWPAAECAGASVGGSIISRIAALVASNRRSSLPKRPRASPPFPAFA